jgi:hypothetical protein
MNYRWMPLLGEFDVVDEEIRFLGKPIQYQDQPAPAVGNLISDQRFPGGTVEATVLFDDVKERSAAELILSYDPQSRAFLLAGLGGLPWAMFDIRDFRPGVIDPPWTNHGAAGARENLKGGRPYKVKATVSGSLVSLHVDDVHVLSATLPYALQEQQVGLWCMADHIIRVTDFHVTPAKPRAFIVMEFSSPFNEIYVDVIKKACEDNGVEAVRADEIYGPGLIIGDVVQEILRSKLIIADVTPQNANVFFEVGYGFALNKPTILLAEKTTKLPFDLSAFRVLFYENSIAGKAKIEQGLQKHIKAILGVP